MLLSAKKSSFEFVAGYGYYRSRHYFGAPNIFGAITVRYNSSESRKKHQQQKKKKQTEFHLDALPFSISPEEALDKFKKWAVDEQGLYYLLRWDNVRIGAAYVPVWSFDVNLRFVVTDGDRKKRYNWKPSIFSVYGDKNSVIHLPGLSSYAGHSYRRSLINPIVNSTLVFMGDQTQPFGNWMLRDMELSNGATLQVVPDVWNATRGQSYRFLFEDFETLAEQEIEDGHTVKVQSEIVSSRRVYLPIYYIDYSILGMEYRVFASGCDSAAGISGVSHKVVPGSSTQQVQQESFNILSQVGSAAQAGFRLFGGRNIAKAVVLGLQLFGNIAARFLVRIPVIGVFAGLFVGFRKIIQPWMDNQRATAEWERQRDHEAYMADDDSSNMFDFGKDFVDYSGAQQYFMNNREKILNFLGGSNPHEQGDFEWYKEWEEWARRQWEQQQRQSTYEQQQQYYQYGQQQQQQQQRTRRQKRKTKAKPEFQWDFDVNDPYSVLGIQRGASKSEVSAAFRREMLKHHPDTQAGASEAAKTRATERSKIITDAYRKIKASYKR